MPYQNDNLNDFVANAAQPIDLTFKVDLCQNMQKEGNNRVIFMNEFQKRQ